jgi:DNA-binding NarL/FixJ family response regulator
MCDRKGLRVLAVDDHPVFLRGLVATFEDAEDMYLVGTCGTAMACLEAVQEATPDVVLLDLNLPDLNGIQTTRELAARGFAGGVLILTMYEDEVALIAAVEAGARGYLLKGADQNEILSAIRSVAGGGLVFGPQLADRVMRMVGSGQAVTRVPGLSVRENEILDLIASGNTNHDIARRLVLSDKTVRNHITNIFAKMSVSTRQEAIAKARGVGARSGPDPKSWQTP